MNDSELAKLMLEWEELEAQQKIIEETVEKEVLKRGKTFVVGNVRATYSNPRRSFDYEAAVNANIRNEEARQRYIADFSTEVVKIDWKAICDEYGIQGEDIPVTVSGEPKVTLKVK